MKNRMTGGGTAQTIKETSISTKFAATRPHVSLIKAPVEGGVLGFHWVNFIVAQASRWHYLDSPASMHFGRVIYFLGVFAGAWPLRKERLGFALRKSLHHSFERWYLQVHFRYFADAAKPEKYEVTRGLQCTREKGKIASDSLDTSFYSFEEKRISVFGLISAEEYSSPQTTPAFYNVLALGETKFGDLDGYILKWQPGLQGTIAFQIALLASVDVWETEWNKVLDRIDACLQFQLGQTSSRTEVDAWMFDDNFERSRLYFTTLQILRLFGGCISTLSDDLRPLDDLFLKRSNFPMPNMRQNELQALRSNWELVRETQRIAQKNLSDRVLNKTEEIKGLRDGLLNASSLREAKASLRQANRSSEMSRYVLMFTVVTVLYLPPSFISTVFALDIFKKDPVQTKWEYKVSIVSVSLFTYTMALALVIATDWKNFRRRCSSRWVKFSTWWIKFFQWRGDSSSSENTTGTLDDFAADDFAVDEPASLAPEQGSKPEETRSAHEVGDEESGPLKAKRQWSSPFLGSGKSGESSGQKDKGKALEEIPMTAMYTPNKRGAGFVSEGPRRGYTTYITGLQIEET
ncbi:hypothetical protein F4679DRAFT_563501 [Xylaria curta]|nr:hypothetical protein F4679DRAFT_563501 [Xylaria curta]